VSKTLSAGDEVGDGQNRLSQGQRVAVETSPRYCVQLLGCVVPHLHRWLVLPPHASLSCDQTACWAPGSLLAGTLGTVSHSVTQAQGPVRSSSAFLGPA
jgi:hypothetical protein